MLKRMYLETEIISHSGFTDLEVKSHLNELEWLHLVKEAVPTPNHEEFKLWNLTEKGLQEISRQDPMRAIVLFAYQLIKLTVY